VYEGRLVRWGYAPSRPVVQEYGRTGSATDASAEDIARWRASPFFHMLQTGENVLHRRVAEKSEPDFPVFKDYRADGMTDYWPSSTGSRPRTPSEKWIASILHG
jgi:adenylate cyclase